MNLFQMDTAILISNGLILLGGLYLVFFKSYFNEKGKNLATKEDIEQITKKVEAIKVEFIKETERLKFELQFETQVNLGYHNEMKSAVIHLYETYSLWLTSLSEAQDNSIDYESKKINAVIEDLSLIYTKFLLAESKTELYISERSFLDKLDQLKIATVKFHNLIETFLVKQAHLQEDIEELDFEQDQSDEVNNSIEINEKQDLSIANYKDFQSSVKEDYKSIIADHRVFGDFCRSLIKNLKVA